MSKFKLYIEYEGTRYSGWQKQQNAKTIQGTLFNIGTEIFKTSGFDLQGSGRTDSGVHALCQIAHLDVKTMLSPEIIRLKFNDLLPSDINILEVQKINSNFHARHDAVSRSYIYQVSRRRTAFGKNYVWWIKDTLNFDLMSSASFNFIGMHDFTSFSDEDKEEKSTKVQIENIEMKEAGSIILIRITGSHFLWKMVRRMVGTLVEIGRGKLNEKDLLFYLNNKSKDPSRFTAPPSGLFLESVLYKNEINSRKLLPIISI
ncbi:MAG: tRNA pseudouridine(38-40) synthase TruA [Ignavibacteriaceae bacterium]|nr:tRNA pseudouridine(38-40) synthase TruA [Ignavibacteriaceae bacterium]